jgi:hypothetical protein
MTHQRPLVPQHDNRGDQGNGYNNHGEEDNIAQPEAIRVHLVCQNSDRAPTRATHSLDAGSVVSHGVGVISLAEAIAPPISS